MPSETNLTTLKINYLTQAQYDTALANNQINANELYFTPASNQEISINLNGSEVTSPSFYAPVGSGTIGQYLKSNGVGNAPEWTSELDSSKLSGTIPAGLYTNSNTTYTLSGALSEHTITSTLTAGGSGSGTSTSSFTLEEGTGITITDDTAARKMTIAAINNGTVTSVSVSGSGGITVSGSPITSSGTITIGLNASSITAGKAVADQNGYNIDSNYVALGKNFTALVNGTDLNTITTPGNYKAYNSATAQSLSNCPITTWFIMRVGYTDGTSDNWEFQEIIQGNNGSRYYRQHNGGTWTAWQSFLSTSNYLPLTGGTVTGPTIFNNSVSIDSLTTGNIVVNGGISAVNGINNFIINTSASNLNADDVRTSNGIWLSTSAITNAATANWGALFNDSRGTPYQLFIPDSTNMYIYKRYYSSNAWSAWSKLSAGYADVASNTEIIRIGNANTINVNSAPTAHRGKVQEYGPSCLNLPTSAWYFVETWRGDDNNYCVQLALGETTEDAYFRVLQSNNWGSWKRITTGARTITMSTSNPSGGANGDVWFVYA